MIPTIEPGYGDAFKEDQEEQTHAAGRVVVEEFEHVDSPLVRIKRKMLLNHLNTDLLLLIFFFIMV